MLAFGLWRKPQHTAEPTPTRREQAQSTQKGPITYPGKPDSVCATLYRLLFMGLNTLMLRVDFWRNADITGTTGHDI